MANQRLTDQTHPVLFADRLRRAIAAATSLAIASTTGLPAFADTIDLPITHIEPGRFPLLKTKASNSNFALDGAAGNAVMRWRYGTETDAKGDKTYVFGYQLELKATYGVNGPAGITSATLDLPAVPPLVAAASLPDGTKVYAADEDGGEKAGVNLHSAALVDGKMVFTFAAPVKAGKAPGDGQHSVWFGLVTTFHAHRGTVTLTPMPTAQKKAGASAITDPASPQQVQVMLPAPTTDNN
jgi:hypothetical protein